MKIFVAITLLCMVVAGLYFQKYLVQLYYRLTAPAADITLAEQPDAATTMATYTLDFADPNADANLFLVPDDDEGVTLATIHKLDLRGLADHSAVLTSWKTQLHYRDRRLFWMTTYPTADNLDYRDALTAAGDALRTLGLHNNWQPLEYNNHMGEVLNKEIWVPTINLANAQLEVMLNCSWQWHVPAVEQLDQVRCRPYLSIYPADR